MFKKKKSLEDITKTKAYFESSKLVPIESIQNGIVKDKSGFYYIIFDVKGPNIFLKEEKEQISLYLSFREFLASLSENEKIQILVVSRIMKLVPFLENLQYKIDNLSGKLQEFAAAELDFLLSLIQEHEILERKTLLSVFLDVPFNVKKEEERDRIAADMAEKTTRTIENFAIRFDVGVRRLTTEEILEYFFTELNPDLPGYPIVKATENVSFFSKLSEEDLDKIEQYAPQIQTEEKQTKKPIEEVKDDEIRIL